MKKSKFLIVILIMLIFSFPLVYADDSSGDVSLTNFPMALSNAFGLPTSGDYFAGKLLASLIFLCIVLFPVIILTKGKNMIATLFAGFGVLSFSTAMGWFPIWSMAILVLVTVVFFGRDIIKEF